MTDWQTAFFILLATILAVSAVWWLASWANDTPIRDDWRSSRDEAWEQHTAEAVALGNGLACGDRLATDLAAVMAPQLIDAAERILREETA